MLRHSMTTFTSVGAINIWVISDKQGVLRQNSLTGCIELTKWLFAHLKESCWVLTVYLCLHNPTELFHEIATSSPKAWLIIIIQGSLHMATSARSEIVWGGYLSRKDVNSVIPKVMIVTPAKAHRELKLMRTKKSFGTNWTALQANNRTGTISAASICDNFHKSSETRVLPENRKGANISTIFKGGAANQPANYHW